MKPTPKVSKSRKSNNSKKRKKKSTDDSVVAWVKKLEQIDSLSRNHGELSINFKEYFMSFCKRLESETTYQIKEENVFVGMNNYSNQNSDLNQNKKQKQNVDQTDQDFNLNLNFNDDVPDYYRNIF